MGDGARKFLHDMNMSHLIQVNALLGLCGYTEDTIEIVRKLLSKAMRELAQYDMVAVLSEEPSDE